MGDSNFEVEKAFTDPDLIKKIKWYCFKRGLSPREMMQEVFAEILDSEASSMAQCFKIANRVTQEHRRLMDDIESNETIYEEDGEIRSTDNWYWRGCDPRMNGEVEEGLGWE